MRPHLYLQLLSTTHIMVSHIIISFIYQNVIIKEIKYTINVTHLNHPETQPLPLQSMEKLPSMKPIPGIKKARDCCSVGLFLSKQVNTKICSFLI